MVIIKQLPVEGTVVLVVDGRIDTLTAPELDQTIKQSLTGTRKLVLDLTSVGYISSAGLRVVMATQKAMSASGGQFVVKGVQKEVMQVFAMTGFTRILTFE